LKAIVYYKYGSPDLLRLEEVAMPTPTDDEVLIKVYAVSVNRSDWEGLTGKPLYARIGGLFRPGHHILGSDIAGWVETVGKNISDFQPGDEVFGETMRYCDGFAEYVSVPVKALARKPASMSFAEASAIPQAGVIALLGIREKGQVQPGQKVLINGAGGGSGSFAVQLAKLYGAEVSGVDNAGKLEFIRSLGADHVIDYSREDFTRNGKEYDLILDLIAYRSAYAYARALRPNGTYYCVGGSLATLLQIFLLGPRIKRTTGKNVRVLLVQPNRKDLVSITELCEAGKVTPMIDRIYPLSEVPEALRHLGEGRALGKLVITLENSKV
jgi:NADPH:quinone reductase-like Zn-dependent oxidoreductase